MGVRTLPPVAEYRIMLSQSIGAPSRPVVKAGDVVARGAILGEAGGFVSAPVHAPCAARVKKLERIRDLQGMWRDCVTLEPLSLAELEADPSLDAWPEPRTEAEIAALSDKDIIGIVGDCGIVGLGGATFPTRVKLSIPEGKKAEMVIINGAECEPCLTCDDQLMRACPEQIMEGIKFLMRATNAPKAIVGIETNKPEAIERMRRAAAESGADISVMSLRTRYPQGGEKQLIEAITGRQVPCGGLPIDVGVVVDNVATAFAVYEAVALRRPLTRRIVTVAGPSVTGECNFMVDNGTPVTHLIDAAGGLPEDTRKIIAGGPMMGRAISQPDAPATKGLSGVVILPEDEAMRRPPRPCIRCARCVNVCPMGLEPYLLMNLAKMRLAPEVREAGVMNCLECGCCTYICPSARPMVDYIRLGKQIAKNLP